MNISGIAKKIFSELGALKRIRHLLDDNMCVTFYRGLIAPHFNYCSVVLDGLNKQLVDKLQKYQNRAARLVTRSSFDTSSQPLFDKHSWDRVSVSKTKLKAITMFKIVNHTALNYLQDLFKSKHIKYNLRDLDKKLELPKPKTN